MMVDPDRPHGEIPPELEKLMVDGSKEITVEEMLRLEEEATLPDHPTRIVYILVGCANR